MNHNHYILTTNCKIDIDGSNIVFCLIFLFVHLGIRRTHHQDQTHMRKHNIFVTIPTVTSYN